MRKYVLVFWKLAGCILLIAAISTGISYRKMVKQDAPPDIAMDETDDAKTAPDPDDGEEDILENQPEGDIAADEPEEVPDDEGTDSRRYNGDIVLETEYDVKEYCKGCFIVSKNDDLLYGLLDIHGNEIIPVKYDSVWFCNDEHVKDKKDENLYIEAKYEDQYTVFDIKGDVIFDRDLLVIDYKYGKADSDSAFWYENNYIEKIFRVYKEDKTLLQEIDYSNFFYLAPAWLSPDNYFACIQESQSGGSCVTYLYDRNTNTKMEWKDAVPLEFTSTDGNEYYFYLLGANGVYEKYSVSDGGTANRLKTMDKDGVEEEAVANANSERNDKEVLVDLNENTRILYSNETYKLEDENGNAIYDERYYACYREHGCYILANEDNQACLVNRNGKMVIDYGWLDDENEKVHFLGEGLNTDHILDGGEEVGIVVKEDGISRVYMFSEIED